MSFLKEPVVLIPVGQMILAVAALGLALDLVRSSRNLAARDLPKLKIGVLAAMVFLLGATASQLWAYRRDSIIPRFHRLYYNGGTWNTARWIGIPTQQNPNDVWIHQELISALKPDFIIEAGTLGGGSAVLWAMILAQVNPAGRVITIDIEDGTSNARKIPIFGEKVEFLLGSSTDPAIVSQLEKRVRGKKVMVILDSNHAKDHVLAELKAYGPMVPVGSYVIVQDTNLNGHPVARDFGPGPMEAVEEFLDGNDQFVSDRVGDKLLFTMHPKGYLRRVR